MLKKILLRCTLLFVFVWILMLVVPVFFSRPDCRFPLRLYGVLWLVGLLFTLGSFLYSRKQLARSEGSVAIQSTLRRRYENILSAAGEGIISLDRNFCHDFVNPAAEKMLGYTQTELLGISSHQSWHARRDATSVYPVAECPICQAMLSGKEVNLSRHRFMRKDGSFFPVSVSVAPIIDDGKNHGSVLVFQDISEHLASEARMKKQLFQAQKMEAVGALASGVAHDFNNILTVINSFSESLIEECAADSPIRSDLIEIHEAGRRAADLTRQLLAFSRRQTIVPKEICLRLLIVNLMKMLHRLLGEDIELNFNLPEPGVKIMVKADPGQLEQVIVNLLVNARDALRHPGAAAGAKEIFLLLDKVVLDEAFVTAHLGSRVGRYAFIEIKDRGSGMSPEDLEHCFEPFYTTKKLGQGTGLGLSTVYGIVKQNDGYITISSELGKGTTIRIYWPLLLNTISPSVAVEEPERDLSRFKGLTVLVAEDDEKICKIAGDRLRQAGFQVITAGDGFEALEKVAAAGKAPDLLFTDVVMPGLGGVELSRRLKETRPALPVLFSSGYSDVSQVKTLGVREAFIQKPYTITSLLAAIAELLDV